MIILSLLIRGIIPCAIGWIGCEIYHRWEDKNECIFCDNDNNTDSK